jgi:diguanylate cyclase (GGDEF)-like protein
MEPAPHDALTGLASHRSVRGELDRRSKANAPFSIFYIAINGFKEINDTYGHHAGDHLLKQVADRLKSAFRSSDVVGHWEGDEFVGLVHGRFGDDDANIKRIERCFNDAFLVDTSIAATQVHVTATIGVAAWKPGENVTEVLSRASAAMYVKRQKDSL